MAPRVRELLGVGGVSRHERAIAREWHRRFEWLLVPLALWLPLQWYLEIHGELSREHVRLLDWAVWAAFLAETLVLSALVDDRWRYLRHNWINLVIVVFAFPLYWHTTGPWIAMARLLRLLVLFGVVLRIVGFFRGLLGRNQIGPVIVVLLVITSLAGSFVAAIDPAFHSAGDGIWWAWQTVTMVGYGDFAPQSAPGRVIAVVLMLFGVGLIGTFAATMSEVFMEEEERRSRKQRAEILDRLVQNEQDFETAAKDRAEILERLAEIAKRLDRLDKR